MAPLSQQGSASSATMRAAALPLDLLHHDLVAYMADLEIALELGIAADAFRVALDELLERIKEELVAEERFMRRIGYPGCDVHREAHETLLLRLQGALELCTGAEHGSLDPLLGCLRTWLAQHHASMDDALSAYTSSH